MSSPRVRPARPDDATAMARVHVRCWQQTYRGLMPDHVLDDPGFVDARQRLWTHVLAVQDDRGHRTAVATADDEIVGIAMSGPPVDDDAAWSRQLFVLYLDAAHHGTGAGPGLLEAVIGPEESAALWVAEPNPRAQAFYRKHGFTPDGATTVADGVTDLRMVRTPEA
ncbi:GNAT family N-acetyltransferase [Isoptericola haloaureus]|uniref:GNAT family N-acetyltransferase n=1 Tax=Isoptericola haloaureus TaxID=1542902 RepID=A0ABU7Z2G5_9MICO